MSWATNEVVTILAFLLPGFVAVTVFYALTSHPKPSELERIVQALAFTIASQATASVVVHFLSLTNTEVRWAEFEEIVLPFVISVALGSIAVVAANHDFPHRFLREIGFTKETSYPSEWYGAFAENDGQYVVLHLKNGNRLYGWPEDWPRRPGQGHFRLSECEWLIGSERRPLLEVSVMLIPAQDVDMVEFIQIEQSKAAEEE